MNMGGTIRLKGDIQVTMVHAVCFPSIILFSSIPAASRRLLARSSTVANQPALWSTHQTVRVCSTLNCRPPHLSLRRHRGIQRYEGDRWHLHSWCGASVHRRLLYHGAARGCLCGEQCTDLWKIIPSSFCTARPSFPCTSRHSEHLRGLRTSSRVWLLERIVWCKNLSPESPWCCYVFSSITLHTSIQHYHKCETKKHPVWY